MMHIFTLHISTASLAPHLKRNAGPSRLPSPGVPLLPPDRRRRQNRDHRALSYDLENRPLAISRNGLATAFAYGPDGERWSKTSVAGLTHYLGPGTGNDAELLFDLANPAGQLTSHLHADVKREGSATDYQIKDHLASNRLTIRHGLTLNRHDYGPYGTPLTSNGSTIPGGPMGGKLHTECDRVAIHIGQNSRNSTLFPCCCAKMA
jgi:hypothetical protein